MMLMDMFDLKKKTMTMTGRCVCWLCAGCGGGQVQA
jgi:hypothetical protein